MSSDETTASAPQAMETFCKIHSVFIQWMPIYTMSWLLTDLDHTRIISPALLNGVQLQRVSALSTENKRKLREQLLSSMTAFIDANRAQGIALLQKILAPYQIPYEFYPGRNTLPAKLQGAPEPEVQRFARNPNNPGEERLAAILWSDTERSTETQKAMIYRFIVTLLHLLSNAFVEKTNIYELKF